MSIPLTKISRELALIKAKAYCSERAIVLMKAASEQRVKKKLIIKTLKITKIQHRRVPALQKNKKDADLMENILKFCQKADQTRLTEVTPANIIELE